MKNFKNFQRKAKKTGETEGNIVDLTEFRRDQSHIYNNVNNDTLQSDLYMHYTMCGPEKPDNVSFNVRYTTNSQTSTYDM